LHLVDAELWEALQGLKSILIIVNDGNLHSTFVLVKSVSVVVSFILSSFAIPSTIHPSRSSISSPVEHLGSNSYCTGCQCSRG
jgi:hypothetical protein